MVVQPTLARFRMAADFRIGNGQRLSGVVNRASTALYAACGIAAVDTSPTTSGLLAITSNSTRAAASGWRRPCSHSRTALVVNPNRLAKLAWLSPVRARIARTSTWAGGCQTREGAILPSMISTASSRGDQFVSHVHALCHCVSFRRYPAGSASLVRSRPTWRGVAQATGSPARSSRNQQRQHGHLGRCH